MYVCMYVCIHTYIHTYIRTYIHTYIHTYIRHICIYIHIYICIQYLLVKLRAHKCIYIYTLRCTIYIYTRRFKALEWPSAPRGPRFRLADSSLYEAGRRTYMYAYMYICIRMYLCFLYSCIHVYTYIYIHIHVCTCVYVHRYMPTCINTYVSMYASDLSFSFMVVPYLNLHPPSLRPVGSPANLTGSFWEVVTAPARSQAVELTLCVKPG